MCRWLITLLLLVSSAASAAPAWTWVDEQGRRHFSDRPVPGATRIDLPETAPATRPVQPTTASTATRPATAASAASQPAPANERYTQFDIVSPTQEQTLWNLGGTLPVQVSVQPGLQPNHVVDVLLDGRRVGLRTVGTQLTVPEVFRGVHTLQAVISDESTGREVLRSQEITFNVQQNSLLNPNNPNNAPRRSF